MFVFFFLFLTVFTLLFFFFFSFVACELLILHSFQSLAFLFGRMGQRQVLAFHFPSGFGWRGRDGIGNGELRVP